MVESELEHFQAFVVQVYRAGVFWGFMMETSYTLNCVLPEKYIVTEDWVNTYSVFNVYHSYVMHIMYVDIIHEGYMYFQVLLIFCAFSTIPLWSFWIFHSVAYLNILQVNVKFTGHIVECGDLEKVITDPAGSRDIVSALELVLKQGVVLKPE